MDLQQFHEQLQSAQRSMEAELSKATQYAERISVELIETNKILVQKTESQQHWQIQHDKIYIKWEEQMKIITELHSQNAVLSPQIAAMKIQLSDLAEQNKVLAHDKWILGQEKAQLYGQLKQLGLAVANG